MTFKNLYETVTTVKKALRFMYKAHDGQVRKFSGEPYVVHPRSVANTIWKLTKDESLAIAGAFHDVIEDTKFTYEDIASEFGTYIADLVKELTSDPELIKKFGKTDYLVNKMNRMTDDALLIKLADRLSNVSDFGSDGKKFRDKYGPATREIISRIKVRNELHKKLLKQISDKIEEFGY